LRSPSYATPSCPFSPVAEPRSQTLLVPEWTFDILHEFVYQFQSFCQYRTQVSSREPAELEALAAAPTAWAAPSVYRYLEVRNGSRAWGVRCWCRARRDERDVRPNEERRRPLFAARSPPVVFDSSVRQRCVVSVEGTPAGRGRDGGARSPRDEINIRYFGDIVASRVTQVA